MFSYESMHYLKKRATPNQIIIYKDAPLLNKALNKEIMSIGPWWSSGLERRISHYFVLELKVEGSNPGVIFFFSIGRFKRLIERSGN